MSIKWYTELRTCCLGFATGSAAILAIYMYRLKKIERDRHHVLGMDFQHPQQSEQRDMDQIVFGFKYDPDIPREIYTIQCSHALLVAYAKALEEDPNSLRKWISDGGHTRPIRLEFKNQMYDFQKEAKKLKVRCVIIEDTGNEQVPEGYRSVCAIGPAPKSVLDTFISPSLNY